MNKALVFGMLIMAVVYCYQQENRIYSLEKSIKDQFEKQQQNKENRLRVSLEKHKASEQILVKYMFYYKHITEAEYYTMLNRAMED